MTDLVTHADGRDTSRLLRFGLPKGSSGASGSTAGAPPAASSRAVRRRQVPVPPTSTGPRPPWRDAGQRPTVSRSAAAGSLAAGLPFPARGSPLT